MVWGGVWLTLIVGPRVQVFRGQPEPFGFRQLPRGLVPAEIESAKKWGRSGLIPAQPPFLARYYRGDP
jgi:hypothetical protein